MDVRKANGGVFLGLNGIVVKSHGGTDAEGFAAAVELGYDMVRAKLINEASRKNCPRSGGRAPGNGSRGCSKVDHE
jgi:fatty acid/phospholipid biosynthesis enzyme